MEDLEKLKTGQMPQVRRNDAARFAAESQLFPQQLEPSLKAKLIEDQAKINSLKQQKRQTINDMMPEIDDIDVL